MIRIEASNQAGTQVRNLDVQHTPVEFNYAIQELSNISNSRSPHSLRFSMPMTDNNNKFFGEFYNVNFNSATFDAGVKTNVQVFDSGVPIMVGVLQLHKVTPFTSKYEVSVLAEVASFFDSVKDLTFEELFVTEAGLIDTDLDHALTSANITNSWDITNDITSGNVGAGVIVYPLSDWGLAVSDGDENLNTGFYHWGNDTQNFGMGEGIYALTMTHLTANCFKPAIRVNWLINRIAQKAGFTISSDFLTNDVSNLYMFLATEEDRAVGRPAYASLVGLDADYTLQSSVSTIGSFIPFEKETPAPYNDVDGLFNSGVFVAPLSATYYFQFQFVVESNASPLTGDFVLTAKVYKNYDETTENTPIMGGSQYQPFTYGDTQVWGGQIFSDYLETGDTLTLILEHSIGGNTVKIKQSVGDNYSFWSLLEYNTAEIFVDASSNFPDLKVGEFLTEIFNRFNLMLYTYPDAPTVIYVEPYNDILSATAEKKDWTEKIDANSIAIEPTTKYQKKTVTFEDGSGKDHKNSWWEKTYGYVKGRWIYENPNEFATGSERIGGAFQPLRLDLIPSAPTNPATQVPNVLVPRFYNLAFDTQGTKELVEAKPVLAFYHGKKDIGNDREFKVGGFQTGAVQVTQYPFFSEFSTSPVTTSTIALSWSINWGDENGHPLINAGNTPGVTNMHCFRKFWARRMHEEYSSESRVMTCQAYLTPLDVNTLRWNDEIFIKDCFWRVVKVSNFSTGQEKPANLELVKLINASDWNKTELCTSYPLSFNVDGTVNFVDLATGAAVSPTEPCCTDNGFVWDEDAGVCFWKAGTTGGNGKGKGGNLAMAQLKSVGLSMTGSKVITDIPFAEGKSMESNGIFASKNSFYMTCKTTDNANTAAASEAGMDEFDLVPNAVYMVNVDIVTVDTGGSAATLGNVMTMRYQGTIANTAGTSRSVGQTLINSEADAGAARTITINQKQDSGGRPSYLQVLCAGETNKDITWVLDVEIVQLAFSDDSTISVGAIWNETSDPLITLNLATNQYLTWNL
tara:strand:- start:2362 stop:5436 length:3075 start_codon:yes stop_codon:yes gene_type:complete